MFGKLGPAGQEVLSKAPKKSFARISNGLICNFHSNLSELCKPPFVDTRLIRIGSNTADTIPTASIDAVASFPSLVRIIFLFLKSSERIM